MFFSKNARSGLSAHKKICTGKAVAGSKNPLGTSTINATIPIISNGAVSPSARAMPTIAPVNIPGSASGATWWNVDCTELAPMPSAASRMLGGTARRLARDAMIIVGSVISDNTIPPQAAKIAAIRMCSGISKARAIQTQSTEPPPSC